jgi:MOSC domain-containing protein YiiM
MDAICKGLRERMLEDRQGVLAEVRRSGKVRVGDQIRVVAKPGTMDGCGAVLRSA